MCKKVSSSRKQVIAILKNSKGSGLAGVITGICGLLLMVLVFVYMADYALYSIKRSNIAHGIDTAVCAAIQEIDVKESETGLSNGFDETTGKVVVDQIVLNEGSADNAFYILLVRMGMNEEAAMYKKRALNAVVFYVIAEGI